MHLDTTPLPLRDDTLLGVCEGLGLALGINPNIPRIIFSALLLWNPLIIVGLYLALGLVVAVVYWVAPDVRVPAAQAVDMSACPEPANSDNEAAHAA